MAANQNRNIELKFDKELELSSSQTATGDQAGTSNYVDLGASTDGYPTVYGQFQVSASDDASGNETYELELHCSSTSGFTVVDNFAHVTVDRGEVGKFVVAMNPTQRYVRAYADVGGTTPSITWAAFLGIIQG